MKRISILLVLLLVALLLFACGKKESKGNDTKQPANESSTSSVLPKPSDTDEIPTTSVPPTEGNCVVLTTASEFTDGISSVTYTINDVEYFGLINSQGKIIYSTEIAENEEIYSVAIGDGYAIISRYDCEIDEYVSVYTVNNTGEIVASFEAGTEVVAYGDGLVLLYQRKETIAEIEHRYGIIDVTGTWIQPMVNLGLEYDRWYGWKSDGWYSYYAGDGMFAVCARYSWGDYDFVFWNAHDGNQFFVSQLVNKPMFTDGVALVYRTDRWGQIINPFHVSDLYNDESGDYTPEQFLLHKDGTYQTVDLSGKEIKGVSNGYCYYTTWDDTALHIVDIQSLDQDFLVYKDYPADMIQSIKVIGDRILVIIQGANSHIYFTLIDKAGKQQFEPIETQNWDSWSTDHGLDYSDGIVIYKNTDGKYCFADETGKITVTDYDYLSKFDSGIAYACMETDEQDIGIYIDKNNKQVLETVELP